MFNGCYSLSSLNLFNFNTTNVVDMKGMFCYCHNLYNLKLSNFNTENVIDMSSMFRYCYNLDGKNVITNDEKIKSMFKS